ncbi:MAG: hypothetical protein ABSH20_08220 [Tepidisphaeraceae bacterium]|jgi:prepilin-type processing-associated H-X9-DG protein
MEQVNEDNERQLFPLHHRAGGSPGRVELACLRRYGQPARRTDCGGTAQKAWTYTRNLPGGPVPASGSYGFNGWLMRWEGVGQGSQPYSGGNEGQYASGNTPAAGRLPVIADATWLDAWPRATDPAPPDLQGGNREHQGWQRAPNENMMARFTIARHGLAINIGYLDGHASTVVLADLKRQMWHNAWAEQGWSPALPGR